MAETQDVPDNRYIVRRRQTWYVRIAVPPRLVKRLGKTHIVRSLGTRDAVEARERRWAAIEQIRTEWRRIEGRVAWEPVSRALGHREAYFAADPALLEDEPDAGGYDVSAREEVHHAIKDDVDELVLAGRRADAALLYRIATEENVAALADAETKWLAEIDGSQAERSMMLHRGVLTELHAAFPKAVLASDIDRRKAGEFVASQRREKGLSPATINRKLWSLSSFWTWMGRRGLIDEGVNPWKGQGEPSTKRAARAVSEGRDVAKRPFTPTELVGLLGANPEEHSAGGYSSEISDLMRLGLVTGCRLEELCELRIADVKAHDRAIFIRAGKTKNAKRVVPVLDAAWGIIERRLKDAPKGQPQAFLWPKLKARGQDKKRSAYISKVFTRLRRSALGEAEEMDMASGRKKSPVDFHSFRRTFTTYLEHASTKTIAVNSTVIAELMGHEKGTLALDRYSGGFRMKHLRDAIDAMGEVMEPEVLRLISDAPPMHSPPIDEATA